MAKYMNVVNHGKGQIDLRHLGKDAYRAKPTEFHFKENGAIDDGPSIAIVMSAVGIGISIFGEMSITTLQECLDEVGYTLIKKQ